MHRILMTPGLELSVSIESKALSSTKALRVCAVGQALPDRNEKTSITMHFTRKSPWASPLCDAHIH